MMEISAMRHFEFQTFRYIVCLFVALNVGLWFLFQAQAPHLSDQVSRRSVVGFRLQGLELKD